MIPIVLGFMLAVVVGALASRLATSADVHVARDAVPTLALALTPLAENRSATLEQVLEAARAAALPIETIENGFDVFVQPWTAGVRRRAIRVRSWDRRNVTPASLTVTCTAPVGVFPFLLALVPLFGALEIRIGDERIVVDGTKDHLDLDWEFARRRRRADGWP